MEPIFLTNLSPASVDPEELVNREGDGKWLRSGLEAWLGAADPRPGGAFCILGEKGIGKSILTRQVISQLREVHSGTTLFLCVDCRPLRTQRDVYREAATQLVAELQLRQKVSDALVAEAQAFDTLTRFDEVSLKHAHEHLVQYSAGLNLGVGASLFKWLEGKLGVSLNRSKKTIENLEGSITVDGPRLYEAFVRLVDDIHQNGELRVVLYLDNIEELNHEALRRDDAREAVRVDVEALLHLSEAPLALVLNMRNYYSSVLTRRISKRRKLRSLPASEQLEIFNNRLKRERDEDRKLIQESEAAQAALKQLAELARTPLAFLTWAEFILEEGLCEEQDMANALLRRLETHYSTVATFIPRVVALFASAEVGVDADAIQAACGRSDSAFRQLIDNQVILPINYWDPREFRLDPEFAFLVGRDDLLAG